MPQLADSCKLKASGSISCWIHGHRDGSTHSHGTGTHVEQLQQAPHTMQVWVNWLCEALSGMDVKMGSGGWAVNAVMGLFAAFGMDAISHHS